ncbi:MAG: TRAP transporter TatT component family protein [Myxococcota bacterium]
MTSHPRRLFFLGLLATALLASGFATGCAASRTSALAEDDTKQEVVKGDFQKTLDEADSHWEKRKDRAELEKAIELYEKAVRMEDTALGEDEYNDHVARTYERLARAYYFLADAHIRLSVEDEDEVKDEMMATYDKGVTAAERAIKKRDPSFAKKVAEGEKWQNEVSKADPAAVPGLYWYATNLGKWALLEGIATILARKDDIKVTMEFICEEREDYFFGACHRYFGVYWMKIPFGKDAEKSRKHFDASMEMAPNYLATKVLKAEYLAVHEQDRDTFNSLLDEVLQTPADALEAVAPENHYEKEKARRLKKNANDYFR